MLEKLEIRNFQTHRKLVVNFDQSITCVVGSSDVGKSAVLRALRWLCLNKPNGSGFVKWGASRTRVRAWFDGRVISRERWGGSSTYSLDGAEYKAFGATVPGLIQSVINISEMAFQGQHDAPFWLSLSPGQVSRELNAVVNLDLMDEALGRAGAELRRTRAAAEVSQERLAAAQQRRTALDWAARADEALQAAEAAEARYQALRGRRAALQDRLNRLEKAQERAARQPPSPEAMDAAYERWRTVAARRNRLAELLSRLGNAQEQQCRAEQRAKEANQRLEKLTGGRCPICRAPVKHG